MLQNNIEFYLESLRAANMSPNTIKTYKQALGALLQFVGPQTDVRDIDVNVMRAYIHRLAEKGLSANSRNHALAVFTAFGKSLLDEGILADNIFAVMPRSKMPLRLFSVPSVQTIGTLLDGEMPTAWPARDRAELELLYGTGVRVHEAARLKLDAGGLHVVSSAGLHVIDIADPAHPVEVAFAPTPAPGTSVRVSVDRVYVAAGEAGLLAFRISRSGGPDGAEPQCS